MFKPAALSILVAVAACIQAQTKLDLYRGDEKIGTGTYEERTDHKGHRTSDFKISAKGEAGAKITISKIKVIDAKGFPVKEEEHMTNEIGGVKYERILKVRYDPSGAAILSRYEDRTAFSDVLYAPIPGYSRADASDLWFSRTNPLPGTTVTSTVFDIENHNWMVVETTYVGKKWITVGGRQIEVHEVHDVRDGNLRKVYLDDKGLPVVMRNGSLRTERHF